MNPQDDEIIRLLRALVACPSITPSDAHCQSILMDFLTSLGFHCQRFDNNPVSNFYAEYGAGDPLLLFAGHTDVVPVGDSALWQTPPFELTIKKGRWYGRGVADMKGSIAAMMVAAERWVAASSVKKGRLGFLITSAEEGEHYDLGTPYVMAQLHNQGIVPNYCIVGEPSSTKHVGDVIKIGRRGSLTGKLTLQGKQGHVAYPHLADNPIHKIAPLLAELAKKQWERKTQHFPPTSLQITHIQAGGQATNIIPQAITVHFNIRYAHEQTSESLQKEIQDCFKQYGLEPAIEWTLSGKPFLTATGRLLSVCEDVIRRHTHQSPELSTSGGTSDGRFIAPYGVEVVELGPVNQTIHQVNESIAEGELSSLTNLYSDIIRDLLG